MGILSIDLNNMDLNNSIDLNNTNYGSKPNF